MGEAWQKLQQEIDGNVVGKRNIVGDLYLGQRPNSATENMVPNMQWFFKYQLRTIVLPGFPYLILLC